MKIYNFIFIPFVHEVYGVKLVLVNLKQNKLTVYDPLNINKKVSNNFLLRLLEYTKKFLREESLLNNTEYLRD